MKNLLYKIFNLSKSYSFSSNLIYKKWEFFFIIAFIFFFNTISFSQKPDYKKASYFDSAISLKDRKIIPPKQMSGKEDEEFENKFESEKKYKPGYNFLKSGSSEGVQSGNGIKGAKSPEINFQGIINLDNYTSKIPPDPNGDVGKNAYFQMANGVFEIFDKAGNSLFGPADNSTIWDGFEGPWNIESHVDPIVLYDENAGRWFVAVFVTQSQDGLYYILTAVSKDEDPITSGWNRYAFSFEKIPDYPKFGIWQDAYYMSLNSEGEGKDAVALERDKMLIGSPDAGMISFPIPNLPTTGLRFAMPADCDGLFASVGTPNYYSAISDNAWIGAPEEDLILMWQFKVDWQNPENSTFSQISSLKTIPFDTNFSSVFDNITQPGTTVKLHALSDILMYRTQFRDFGTYQSIVANHTIDVDGTDHAGIRWYELRNSGSGWQIYRQGTFAPDDDNRWQGSIAQNSKGDIALAYSVSGKTTYPSLRFTGRLAGDSKDEMTFEETEIIAGTGSQTTFNRFGDYSLMSVDSESDNFWFTSEYIVKSGDWETRVANIEISYFKDPINFKAEAVSYKDILLKWEKNQDNDDVVIAWNKENKFGSPQNGTDCIAGEKLSDGGEILYSGGDLNFTHSELIPDIRYFYKAWSKNSNIEYSPGITKSVKTEKAIKNLVAQGVSATEIDLKWEKSGDNDILITWSYSNLQGEPKSGINYSQGDSISGSRIVLYKGQANQFNHTNIKEGKKVYYKAWIVSSDLQYYSLSETSAKTTCELISKLPVVIDFSKPELPVCWENYNSSGGQTVWQLENPCKRIINSTTSYNGFALLDRVCNAMESSETAELISRSYNFSGYSEIYIQFEHFINTKLYADASFYYSIDTGKSWVLANKWYQLSKNTDTYGQNLSKSLAGQADVKFKWTYISGIFYDSFWAIDDIYITDEIPESKSYIERISNITSSSCKVNVQVDIAFEPIVEGLIYSLKANQTLESNEINTEILDTLAQEGLFFVTLKDLIPSNTYFIKSFITNSKGTIYSKEIQFKTKCDQIISVFPYLVDFSIQKQTECWLNIDNNQNGAEWNVGKNCPELTATTTANNGFASIGQDCGQLIKANADLISPVLDFSNSKKVYLKFEYYFSDLMSQSSGSVYFSTDNFKTRNQIVKFKKTSNNPDFFIADLTDSLAGKNNVRLIWNYNSGFFYNRFFAIDDILISDQYIIPIPRIIKITNITKNSCKVYTSFNGISIKESGILYSIKPEIKIDNPEVNKIISLSNLSGNYFPEITNLDQGTKYFVASYIITTDNEIYYSDILEFQTLCDKTINKLPYYQDFTSGMPECWENIDNANSGYIWEVKNMPSQTFSSNSGCLVFRSFADIVGKKNSEIITSNFDFSNYSNIYFSFEHVLSVSKDSLTFWFSDDNSKTWNIIAVWKVSTSIPQYFLKDLSSELAGKNNVKFKWNYSGTQTTGFSIIDDIEISNTQPIPKVEILGTENIEKTRATVKCKINSGLQIVEAGIIIADNNNFNNATTINTDMISQDLMFNVQLSDLTENKAYYVKSFAKTQSATGYSLIHVFNTSYDCEQAIRLPYFQDFEVNNIPDCFTIEHDQDVSAKLEINVPESLRSYGTNNFLEIRLQRSLGELRCIFPKFNTSKTGILKIKFISFLYDNFENNFQTKLQISNDGENWFDIQELSAETLKMNTTELNVTKNIGNEYTYLSLTVSGNITYLSWYIDDLNISEIKKKNADISSSEKNVIIYPNPTTGKINIEGIENDIEEICIYNIIGQKVLNLKENTLTNEFDLSGFENGLYIIMVRTKTEIFSAKIIKE